MEFSRSIRYDFWGDEAHTIRRFGMSLSAVAKKTAAMPHLCRTIKKSLIFRKFICVGGVEIFLEACYHGGKTYLRINDSEKGT